MCEFGPEGLWQNGRRRLSPTSSSRISGNHTGNLVLCNRLYLADHSLIFVCIVALRKLLFSNGDFQNIGGPSLWSPLTGLQYLGDLKRDRQVLEVLKYHGGTSPAQRPMLLGAGLH